VFQKNGTAFRRSVGCTLGAPPPEKPELRGHVRRRLGPADLRRRLAGGGRPCCLWRTWPDARVTAVARSSRLTAPSCDSK